MHITIGTTAVLGQAQRRTWSFCACGIGSVGSRRREMVDPPRRLHVAPDC